MTTLGDLINEVQLNLLGYVIDQEQLTILNGAIDADDVTFSAVEATQLSPGLIEIDEELMWVTSVDADNGLVTVQIRGAFGTTAAVHADGALVRNQPKFPRASIKRALNDTIRSVYPDVFAVGTTTLTGSSVLITQELPAAVEEVLDVSWESIGGSEYWIPVRRYRVNMQANTGAFTTGKSIDILDPTLDGRTVQVAYRKVPTALSALADEFATVTGLPESAKECIVYGACARLVGYTEAARMSDDAAEARFMDGNPQGQALNAARYFYQMHLQTRAEEARRLLDRYPPRIHFTR